MKYNIKEIAWMKTMDLKSLSMLGGALVLYFAWKRFGPNNAPPVPEVPRPLKS